MKNLAFQLKREHTELREILLKIGIIIEKNKELAIKNFKKYKLKEIAHLKKEEEIISKNPKLININGINTLLKQHKEITEILNKMEEHLVKKNYLSFDKSYVSLLNLMKTHMRIEENNLYPLLN